LSILLISLAAMGIAARGNAQTTAFSIDPSSGSLPNAEQNSSYDQVFAVDGGGAFTFSFAGVLPNGLVFGTSTDGSSAEITGMPQNATTLPANFTITARNLADGSMASANYNLTVTPVPPKPLPGRPTSTINVFLTVHGGTAATSSFKIHVIASRAKPASFSASNAARPVQIDSYAHYNVNVSEVPNYVASTNNSCNSSGIPPGGSVNCTITETFTGNPAPTSTDATSSAPLTASNSETAIISQLLVNLQTQMAALIQAFASFKIH